MGSLGIGGGGSRWLGERESSGDEKGSEGLSRNALAGGLAGGVEP